MQGVGRYTGARRRTANLPVEYPRSNIAAPGHDPQTPELQRKNTTKRLPHHSEISSV